MIAMVVLMVALLIFILVLSINNGSALGTAMAAGGIGFALGGLFALWSVGRFL